MFVADRMIANPVTIAPDTTVNTAKELMKEHNFRRLPVVENEKLIGWVTENDLRQVAPSSATTLSVYEVNYLLAKLKIRDVMRKDLIVAREDAPIEDAALLMLRHKIGGMPVVNSEEKLVGVITETDLFKAFLDMSGVSSGTMTRFTLKAEDKVGLLEALGGLFARQEMSISSISCYTHERGEAQIVLRVEGEHEKAQAAIPDIERLGIQIVAVHHLNGE
jgi:Predicted transcriptional regulator, contains C-terminal CBS domains